MRITKVDTKVNLADALTKAVDSDTLNYHIKGTNATIYQEVNEYLPGAVNYVHGRRYVVETKAAGKSLCRLGASKTNLKGQCSIRQTRWIQNGRTLSNWEGGSPGSPWHSLLGPRQGGDGESKNHAAVTRGAAKKDDNWEEKIITRGLETPRGSQTIGLRPGITRTRTQFNFSSGNPADWRDGKQTSKRRVDTRPWETGSI